MKQAAATVGPIQEPPLRVFHLIKSLGRGGAETLLLRLVKDCDPERATFGVGFFLPWNNALAPELREAGAEVVCFPAAGSAGLFARTFEVARHLRRWRADVLHCHLPLAGVVGRLAGRLAGVPVVYSEHNLMEQYHPLTRRLNQATWRLQRHAIAVSEGVASSIRRYAPATVALTTIPNGVPVGLFRADGVQRSHLRRSLGIDPMAPVVGTVAGFRPEKRLDLWLDAAVEIAARVPGAHFLLVGDGPLRPALQERASALGLKRSLHLVGSQKDVRGYLAAMDVYMISSDFEGLPVALLEAMATELPVVATRVGGIGEVVIDGETGVVVEPRDVRALVAATVRLLSDAPLRARMGSASRQRVKMSYAIDRMAAGLEAVWRAARAG